ncbi:hypothetical protein OPT61_g5741 [Boeremia exigua]|uniref:Uncharacterized protein n=1 Tax=Boeremia exigua TaxID=749465 RepID=A0ACC2I9C8_9PLEO|nr:hypothetical protein OPT61_g5741 [Boeremia exigua]
MSGFNPDRWNDPTPAMKEHIEAFSTHCNRSGRDNVQGDPRFCPGVEDGGVKRVNYECREHRGLEYCPMGAHDVTIDRGDTWRYAPNTGTSIGSSNNRLVNRHNINLSNAWRLNPHRYEGDPSLRSTQRRAALADDFIENPNERFGAAYWRDPLPWGTARPGGPLMTPREEPGYRRDMLNRMSGYR